MALDPSATPFDRMAVVELLRADPTASIAGLVKLDFDEVLAGRYFEQHSLLHELARRVAGELGDYLELVEIKPVAVDDDGLIVIRVVGQSEELVEHLRDIGEM